MKNNQQKPTLRIYSLSYLLLSFYVSLKLKMIRKMPGDLSLFEQCQLLWDEILKLIFKSIKIISLMINHCTSPPPGDICPWLLKTTRNCSIFSCSKSSFCLWIKLYLHNEGNCEESYLTRCFLEVIVMKLLFPLKTFQCRYFWVSFNNYLKLTILLLCNPISYWPIFLR